MYPHFFANGQAIAHILTRKFSGIGLLLVLFNLAACGWFPAMNLAHRHEPSQYVVLNTWQGSNPFVESKPADEELRPDWWKLYGDPVLDKQVETIEANPDLQAAAERFVQPAT
jgi:multidrug efflux system outer membrane protein